MNDLLQNEYIITAYESVCYIALSFLLFYIGKQVYKVFNPSIDVKQELVEKDNLAFALSNVGYFIGLIIVIGSVIIGPSHGLMADGRAIIIYGMLAIILLNVSMFINDKVILSQFCVRKEIIEDRNSGTGIVEAGNSIASGLIIFGALSGESISITHGVITALSFWGLGQVVLFVTSKVYNWITPYDIHDHIEKDNVAVGVGFAGALIAMGNIIRFAIQDEFVDWVDSLVYVGVIIVVGFVLLPIVRFLTDKILIPGESLTDEIVNQEKANIGVAIIEAFAYIAGSVLITWCL